MHFFSREDKKIILHKNFFNQSQEVIFRSFTDIIKLVGKKYYPTRGKKIENILKLIIAKTQFKVTLGGCVVNKGK
jgi:tRNA(Ile)-lysidine synthase